MSNLPFYIANLIVILEELNDNGVHHGNFSLSSIRLLSNGYLELGGFHKSFHIDQHPERLAEESFQSDRKSVGAIIFRMAKGNPLSEEGAGGGEIDYLDSGIVRIISLLLSDDISDESLFKSIQADQFFGNLDWKSFNDRTEHAPIKLQFE